MDVDKSIENGELTYSDGSLFRPFPFRMIVIIGFIFYACYQTVLEEFGMQEAIAVVLILGLVFWFSKNLFFNYTEGNKLLTIPTELNVTANKEIAIKTIKRLHWKLKKEESQYLIATNNNEYDLLVKVI